MLFHLAVIIALWWGGAALALPTPERIAGDTGSVAVLARPCIVVHTTGRMDLAYSGMARAFASPDLLGDMQREYALQLPAGEQPEFVIQQQTPGSYHYVNRLGQESFIREVHRAEHEGPVTELVLHTWGRRFFGRYEAVIHIAVQPGEGPDLDYQAVVYAYPENGVSRFLARHLGLVERYFRSKTAEIESLSVRLGAALCAPEVAVSPAGGTPPAPRSVH